MFNSADFVIIIILGLIFLYGFYKGIISITVPIIAIIITFIIAPLIYNNLSKIFSHSVILKIISLIATYSVIRIILSKVENGIKKLLKIIFLGWVDRLLGAVALTLVACIIIAFVSSIIMILPPEILKPEYSNQIQNSTILNLIYKFLNANLYIEKFYFDFNK